MPSLKALIFRKVMRWRVQRLSHERTIEDIRRDLDNLASSSKPPEGTEKSMITVNGLSAQWIDPPGADADRVMLYLHGGAYVAGSITSHSNMVAHFAQAAGMRALLVEYRLAPEHPFPAALDDAVASYQWLMDQGYAPERMVIAGDSAGGGLTLATLVYLRDSGVPLPAAAVLMSPWTDLAATGESIQTCARKDPWISAESVVPGGLRYCADTPANHPLVSPLYADLHGLPPVLIQVGDHEILLDDSIRVADKIRAASGVVELEVWKGMWHVFQGFTTLLPESRKAIASVGRFVQQHVPQVASAVQQTIAK